MSKSKENQLWLLKDKVDFSNIKHNVYNLEKQILWDIRHFSRNILDYNIEALHVLINDIKKDVKLSYSNLIIKKLVSIKLRIIKKLEDQKISKCKNFFIKLFSLGKIDKNKNIENKISQFNNVCQHIENNCKIIIKDLNDKIDNLLFKHHLQLEIEKNKLLQLKVEFEWTLKNKEERTKKLEGNIQQNKEQIKQLESNIQQKKEQIKNLTSENDEYKKIQVGHNKKYVDKFITLEGMVRERDQAISFLKQKKVLLKEEISLNSFDDEGIGKSINSIDIQNQPSTSGYKPSSSQM